mgnify:CR=1 FL=1
MTEIKRGDWIKAVNEDGAVQSGIVDVVKPAHGSAFKITLKNTYGYFFVRGVVGEPPAHAMWALAEVRPYENPLPTVPGAQIVLTVGSGRNVKEEILTRGLRDIWRETDGAELEPSDIETHFHDKWRPLFAVDPTQDKINRAMHLLAQRNGLSNLVDYRGVIKDLLSVFGVEIPYDS